MRPLTAVGDVAVACTHAAEAHEQLGVLADHRPRGLPCQTSVVARADHVGEDRLGSRRRVRALLVGAAAEEAHEAMLLARRQAESPCRAPAVGAPEDRRVAVLVAHTGQLGGNQVECGVPVDLHERFLAAQVGGRAGAIAQPRLANCGPHHPVLAEVPQRLAQMRRLRVGGMAPHGQHLAVAGIQQERPKMRPHRRGPHTACAAVSHNRRLRTAVSAPAGGGGRTLCSRDPAGRKLAESPAASPSYCICAFTGPCGLWWGAG